MLKPDARSNISDMPATGPAVDLNDDGTVVGELDFGVEATHRDAQGARRLAGYAEDLGLEFGARAQWGCSNRSPGTASGTVCGN